MKNALVFLCATLLFSSCSSTGTTTPQKKFGKDSFYFAALKSIDAGNEKAAVHDLKIAVKKASPYIARRSAESLTVLGSAKERVESSLYLAKNFDGEESLTIACRELLRNEEYSKIISLTENVDIAYSKNDLVRFRLESLLEKNDSRFEKDFFKWMTCRQLSPEHIILYNKYKDYKAAQFKSMQSDVKNFQDKIDERSRIEKSLAPEFSAEGSNISENESSQSVDEKYLDEAELVLSDEIPLSPEQQLFDYRVNIYRKNFYKAFEQIDEILGLYENFGDEIHDQILSDIGKAALYGSVDFLSSAQKFDALARTLSKPKSYYAYFYSARMYDKIGRYQKNVESRYKSALDASETSIQFDNALWYLLNFQLRTSTGDIIQTLCDYGSMISDAEYFDDFFESLSVLLLSNHKWQDFYEVWKKTNSNFSQHTAGKYAYISGRLLEEGLASGDEGLKTRQTVDAFTTVLSGGGDLYYKLLALERLNLFDNKIIEDTLLVKGKDIPTQAGDAAAGKVIGGYAAFGFPQKIYQEWMYYREKMSVEDSIDAAKFLNSCASLDEKDQHPEYRVQSLRISSRCYNMSYGRLPNELLELSYPQFYKAQIESVCKENNLPKYLMYSLVRSESFFDAGVMSKAGAMGLTQLMPSTADDEARKLKMYDYDILNAMDNLKLGSHYLASLISRMENNSVLLALFAYNAGAKNVRNWVSSSKRDWERSGKFKRGCIAGCDMDLFLETLPFAETREYGRKLVTAAAIYSWLYENESPVEIIRAIMQ